jgi:hypothetical protein
LHVTRCHPLRTLTTNQEAKRNTYQLNRIVLKFLNEV